MDRRSLAPLLLAACLLLLAHLLDPWAHQALANSGLGDTDAGRLLRIAGFLPAWLLAATALALHDGRPRRGALLGGAALSGGLAAELLKVVSGRLRPTGDGIGYAFRDLFATPLTDLSLGVGLPSSHALVAFAATFMLARLFPGPRAVWYLLGIGCAYSRIAAGAHFLSDVTASAIVGYALVALLWHRYATPHRTALKQSL
jgi:membrane-associated phospholipid phosphatase